MKKNEAICLPKLFKNISHSEEFHVIFYSDAQQFLLIVS